METKQANWVTVVLVFVLMAGMRSVWADDDPNGPQGAYTVTSGETYAGDSCPAWQEVFSRDGWDGGQLTIELDTCQIVDYTIHTMAQNDGAGATADLDLDDLIIVWDEDADHGEDEQYKNFTFTGTYVADPNCSYVRLSTTDSRTNWAIYRVTASGTFTKGSEGTNEHEIIQTYRNYIDFTKVDDVNDLDCRAEGEEITYTICWDNDGAYTYEDCYIIDWLPDGVSYNSLLSFSPLVIDENYDPNTHTYTWDIGTIAPGDANCVELTVTVNSKAEPGLYLHNVAELYDSNSLIARATRDTLVCCQVTGDPNIIFVDITATGSDTGVDWENAYSGSNGLQKALARIWDANCIPGPNTIYVAQGTYDPNIPDDTFALTDGLSVYGGFKGGPTNPGERDPKKYETILTGLIDDDAFPDVDTVVTMADETLLDGFTVINAFKNAVYGNGCDFVVENCIVKKSERYGIYTQNGNATVKWCKVLLNDRDGIYHDGAGYTLTVENSWILRNGEIGINCEQSTPSIKNSVISESDLVKYGRAGIQMISPASKPKLHNLTISNNKAEGVSLIHSDPNYFLEENSGNRIEIQNCIVYYNNGNGPQFSERLNMNLDRVAHYSCIADCNEVNYNHNDEPEFAYTVDPNGAPDPNNYHLAADSFCMEKGDPNLSYANQKDMDEDGRLAGTYVDIGADEVDCENVSNTLDWDADGLVNLKEFSTFQQAWLSHDPNDPDITTDPNYIGEPNYVDPNTYAMWQETWKPICDLDPNGTSAYVIDLADLDIFWVDWLWKACWKDAGLFETMNMSGGESMMMAPIMSFESAAIEPVEEVNPYAEMDIPEVISLVVGIHEIIDHIKIAIEEDRKNAKNLTEAKDFLEGVLADIEAARQ